MRIARGKGKIPRFHRDRQERECSTRHRVDGACGAASALPSEGVWPPSCLAMSRATLATRRRASPARAAFSRPNTHLMCDAEMCLPPDRRALITPRGTPAARCRARTSTEAL